ncbi:hypothetical protein Bbelb_257250 [Branchiostoma belcheri]|nr:hypothetical protein Bbelb_257250 [Branchiostoma belcheri]
MSTDLGVPDTRIHKVMHKVTWHRRTDYFSQDYRLPGPAYVTEGLLNFPRTQESQGSSRLAWSLPFSLTKTKIGPECLLIKPCDRGPCSWMTDGPSCAADSRPDVLPCSKGSEFKRNFWDYFVPQVHQPYHNDNAANAEQSLYATQYGDFTPQQQSEVRSC